jgi:molybdopterin-guanine dinucleotide biosynthesis protein A
MRCAIHRAIEAIGHCDNTLIDSAKHSFMPSPMVTQSKNPSVTDYQLIKEVSAVILAGGKSGRYGSNKAFVKIKGIPLIERVIRVVSAVFQDLVLVTNTPREYAFLELPIHQDRIRDLGPLGGILTGLMAIPNEAGFFVACDMPCLNQELIRYMAGVRNDFDVVVPRIAGKAEALHALYTRGCIPAIRGLIDSRRYQIIRFFPDVRVRYVEEDEIRKFDPSLVSFYNVNRPQELRRLNAP